MASPNCTNTDISGIGVRSATYAQNLLSFVPAAVALFNDGKISNSERQFIKDQSTNILLTAFGLLISAIIQAKSEQGLDNYHLALVLNLSWLNNTNTFIYLVLFLHRKIWRSPPGEWSWRVVVPRLFRRHKSTPGDVELVPVAISALQQPETTDQSAQEKPETTDQSAQEKLVENGADIHSPDGLSAPWNAIVEVMIMLSVNEDSADVNSLGGQSLHVASRNGHLEIVRFLVEKGADINGISGQYGYLTPLDQAVAYRHPEIVSFLRDNGAIPSESTSSQICGTLTAIRFFSWKLIKRVYRHFTSRS